MKTGFAGPKNWPCCGVTAVATACEVPFATVLDYMRNKWNLNENWKGSTSLPHRLDALTHFGATYETHDLRCRFHKLRFWQWALLHAKPATTYIVDVPGHSFVFRDHMLIDQAHPKPEYFALCGRLGGASINKIIEIKSIRSTEEREETSKQATCELTDLF